jgi:hypothetical protein
MSRDFDVEVAERVMGWTEIAIRNPNTPGGAVLYGKPPVMPDWESPYNKQRGTCLVPRYSTRIADAWTVVEHMIAQGWTFDLTEQWECIFAKRRGVEGIGREDTAPEAICRAALASVNSQ